MGKHMVATVESLQIALQASDMQWIEKEEADDLSSSGCAVIHAGSSTFIIGPNDEVYSRRIVILSQGDELLDGVPAVGYRDAFQRIHRAALASESSPVRVPHEWNEYHSGNKVAFFACRRVHGAYRWIMEIGPFGSTDLCFWKLTSGADPIDLDQFQVDENAYRSAVGEWQDAYSRAADVFGQVDQSSREDRIQPSIDLDAIGFGAVTRHWTYGTWIGELQGTQKEFVEHALGNSVKLRGPAGSGKTLVLQLKALREVYAARESGREIRVLFATHSWSLAEQVDDAIRQLNEQANAQEIEVYPLLAIAQEKLPKERGAAGFELLGEDSLEGKKLQLDRIQSVVSQLKKGDWIAYRRGATDKFRARVESDEGSAGFRSLVWDLMVEFSSVLAAHGILPGIDAERQYLRLERHDWMIPLDTDDEKRFVLRAYERYIKDLKNDGYITSDQIVSDFLNYLETFAWNLRRDKEGYDLIFVDELHLFNEQERLVFHYLNREPSEYPTVFMALDPRQSPFEVYRGFEDIASQQRESGAADRKLGNVAAIDLNQVHRFTPQILELVRHFHRAYPTLDLGEDWEFDAEAIESLHADGAKPIVVRLETVADERAAALDSVKDLARGATREQRVALIVLDPLEIDRYAEHISDEGNKFVVIRGRDEVPNLRYARRSAVIGGVEYLAGLQFSHVVVAGMPTGVQRSANQGHQLRRFLSLLYLAVSRATDYVKVYFNYESGELPDVVKQAVEMGIVEVE